MSSRASGYKYVTARGGKKKRVYPSRSKPSVSSSRKTYTRRTSAIPSNIIIESKSRPSGHAARLGGVIGSILGPSAGLALAGPVGAGFGVPIGTALGSVVGDAFARITGFGDYKVNRNILLNEGMSPPRIQNRSSVHATTVRHREYIQDIAATTAFTAQEFTLNPGVASTFPWLAAIAANYEEYDIEGAIFEFKSLSSDAPSASFALGSVIMATQYNATNPPFVNKQQMENYEFATSCKPSCSMMHPVECDPHQNPISELYIRTGAVPAGQDQRLYDLGKFTIATVGMPSDFSGQVVGELWITYQVALYKPKLIINEGLSIPSFKAQIVSPSVAAPLGTSQVPSAENTLSMVIDPTGTILTFPEGQNSGIFLITCNWYGTAASCTVPTVTHSSNIIPVAFFNGNSLAGVSAPSGGSSNSQMVTVQAWKILNAPVAGSNTTLTYAGNNFPSAITGSDILVTQIDGGLP